MNIKNFSSKSAWIELCIFVMVAIIFCSPIFYNFNYWGQMDWDQFTFWNVVPRLTLLKYHQFPLWNPYVNGGNVLLAHPHSSFLSPFYLFVLFFGPIVGLKLEIIVHHTLGMLGMFYLAKYMKLNTFSSYLPPFIFMLNSIYALHLTEGHTEWLAMAFVPWLFLCYLKSFKKTKYVLGGIAFLALILLAGSVDVFSVIVIFLFVYALLKGFQIRKIVPVKLLFLIFAGTFLLCSIKLFPMLEFLAQYPRLTNEQSGTSLVVLSEMLLSRRQAIFDALSWDTTEAMGLKYAWHEYGAYVGMIPLVLFFWGTSIKLKEKWPLILTGIICLLIALGSKSPINLWRIIHKFPIYNSLTVPSRFILGFIFCLSICSGLALSRLEKSLPRITNSKNLFAYRLLFSGIILFALFDLSFVNAPIFRNAFVIPPTKVKPDPIFSQKYDRLNFYKEGLSRSSIYPIFLSNGGIIEGREVISVNKGDILISSDPNYKGEVYLAENKGDVSTTYFSPNKIVVDTSVLENDTLVLNQNYHHGWRVKGNRQNEVRPFNGLIATPVTPGHKIMTFYYLPTSFILGSFITGCFILFLCIRKRISKEHN